MKMTPKANLKKPSSVEEFQLKDRFANLSATLLEPRYAGQLNKPLAFWALPTDRGLPLIFLGWSLEQLLGTSFLELLATPGIGQRKIATLIQLLERAAADDPPATAEPAVESSTSAGRGAEPSASAADFDPANVSEAVWVQWRETVKQHDLAHLVLGRLSPSLQSLPTVIWSTPLSFYVDHTLVDIRGMKTHGAKRIRAVLEAFSIVHDALAGARIHESLNIRLEPKFVRPVEQWIHRALSSFVVPTAEEIRLSLAAPLVEQIRIDVGDTVAQLAADRLGLNGPPQSVRRQAAQMDLTRARVYQLLEDCTKVMRVRWPEGESLLTALEYKLRAVDVDGERWRMFYTLLDLFYHGASDHGLAGQRGDYGARSEDGHPSDDGQRSDDHDVVPSDHSQVNDEAEAELEREPELSGVSS